MQKIAIFLLVASAWAAEFQQAKLVDVQPYEVSGTPIVAPNNGYPVLIPTGPYQRFTVTIAMGDTNYSATYPRRKDFDPSKWIVGENVEARIDRDDLIFRRINGKEIKGKIVRRARITQ